jgi:hypothetical protein
MVARMRRLRQREAQAAAGTVDPCIRKACTSWAMTSKRQSMQLLAGPQL